MNFYTNLKIFLLLNALILLITFLLTRQIKPTTEAKIVGTTIEKDDITSKLITTMIGGDNIKSKLNTTTIEKDDIKTRIKSYKLKHNIGNISACVFYGRKIYTEILLRYLDSNLITNGGILDQIIILNHLQPTKVNRTMESNFLENYLSVHRDGYKLVNFIGGYVSFKSLYSSLPDNDFI